MICWITWLHRDGLLDYTGTESRVIAELWCQKRGKQTSHAGGRGVLSTLQDPLTHVRKTRFPYLHSAFPGSHAAGGLSLHLCHPVCIRRPFAGWAYKVWFRATKIGLCGGGKQGSAFAIAAKWRPHSSFMALFVLLSCHYRGLKAFRNPEQQQGTQCLLDCKVQSPAQLLNKTTDICRQCLSKSPSIFSVLQSNGCHYISFTAWIWIKINNPSLPGIWCPLRSKLAVEDSLFYARTSLLFLGVKTQVATQNFK